MNSQYLFVFILMVFFTFLEKLMKLDFKSTIKPSKHYIGFLNRAHDYLDDQKKKIYNAVIINDTAALKKIIKAVKTEFLPVLFNTNLGGGTNYISYRAIHWAVASGHLETINLLIKYNVDLKQKTYFGKDASDLAREYYARDEKQKTSILRELIPHSLKIIRNFFELEETERKIDGKADEIDKNIKSFIVKDYLIQFDSSYIETLKIVIEKKYFLNILERFLIQNNDQKKLNYFFKIMNIIGLENMIDVIDVLNQLNQEIGNIFYRIIDNLRQKKLLPEDQHKKLLNHIKTTTLYEGFKRYATEDLKHSTDDEKKAVLQLKRQKQAIDVDINAQDEKGDTTLHYAAAAGETAVIPSLYQNYNSQNKQGQTPIQVAPEHGQLEMVKKLLEQGVDLGNVLKSAVIAGRLSVLRALLHPEYPYRDHLVEKTIGGLPALVEAAIQSRHIEVLRFLLEIEPTCRDALHEGQAPLHQAVQARNEAAVDLLFDAFADPLQKNQAQLTPGALAQSLARTKSENAGEWKALTIKFKSLAEKRRLQEIHRQKNIEQIFQDVIQELITDKNWAFLKKRPSIWLPLHIKV